MSRKALTPHFTEAKKTELTCRVSEPFFALRGGKTTDKSGEQKPGLGVFPIVITGIDYCAPLTAGTIRIGYKWRRLRIRARRIVCHDGQRYQPRLQIETIRITANNPNPNPNLRKGDDL